MGGKIYVGAENVARKPSGIYVGVNNVAKKVKAGYIGVGGVAKKFWPINLIPDTRYQSLSYLGHSVSDDQIAFNINETFYNYNTRCVYKFKTIQDSFSDYKYLFEIGGEGRYGSGAPVHYNDAPSANKGFYYTIQLNVNKFLFRFEEANWSTSDSRYARTNLISTSTEAFIPNSLYTIDFNNNRNVYLYNPLGYYSISSHNLVGTFQPFHQSFSFIYSGNNSYFNDFYLQIPYGTIFYSAKFYNNGTLIKDFIPCYRVSDHMIGIYDFVNRVAFMSNKQLTDAFIYSE